jgi:Putative peptidoglycan binding domain
MNSKRILWTSCFAAVVLTALSVFGAPHRGSHFSSTRGGQTFSRSGTGTWSGGNWSGGNWSGGNWSGRNWSGRNWSGRNWSGGNWSGDWRHHHRHHSDIIFIGDFGFPWWWGWGWSYPYGYYGYGYGYPYGYDYGYGYPYGYGGSEYGYDYGQPGYGYGYGTKSRVAQLQRRLARAGYYHGAIDGVMGPQTRRAIRAYERDHGYVG